MKTWSGMTVAVPGKAQPFGIPVCVSVNDLKGSLDEFYIRVSSYRIGRCETEEHHRDNSVNRARPWRRMISLYL